MGSIGTVAAAHELFHAAGVYLNTASTGLPPDTAWDELQLVGYRAPSGLAMFGVGLVYRAARVAIQRVAIQRKDVR